MNYATKLPRVKSGRKDRKIQEFFIPLQLEWKKKNKVKQNIISTLMNVETKIWNTMTPTFRYLHYAAYLFQKRTLMP